MNVCQSEVWTAIIMHWNVKVKLKFDCQLSRKYGNKNIPMYMFLQNQYSKCQIFWDYKGSIKAMPNEHMKHAIHQSYNLHIDLTIEERINYSRARQATIESLDDIMTSIIDFMDQNTTIVPRFKQTVKGIDSRFVRTYFCGVLVHGISLYCHIWVDSHHKHDSNQVVRSIMKVLYDVKHKR